MTDKGWLVLQFSTSIAAIIADTLLIIYVPYMRSQGILLLTIAAMYFVKAIQDYEDYKKKIKTDS